MLLGAGIKPLTPLKAIRTRCMDCCGGSRSEVRKCVAHDCASWPGRTFGVIGMKDVFLVGFILLSALVL